MKYVAVGFLFLCILHVHFRGKVRLPFMRQLFDHSSFMAPINLFMQVFSRVPAQPFPDPEPWADLAPLQQNWQVIRSEAVNLLALQKIKAAEQNNDAGFNSFFKTGWKRFYLKWYAAGHPSAERFCPQTVALLRGIPSVKAAMFAELPPGAKLNPHRDPYAGSLRYHLGLSTPNDDRCFIEVDGQRHSWRDGQSVIFDETYIHWAVNGSETNRVILFCDIERPMRFRWAQAINRWLGRTLMTAASSPNETGDQTGVISKLFTISYVMGRYRRRYKEWNKTAYQVTKAGLIIGLVGLIVWL
ncbi:lipid A hydroxylase LpxO [Pseudoduganella sp. FT25W]|jgi:beta-hydroxylase|uniref:Lipid A hydroxylase LpxO n=1 Tax=Duganella alba TaxID=2666081 RepID=A0A6L5QQ13_9BURK|nr:lipid A hydroxylase LpxO [Duganella alba]MRX11769.1 lipid A hydroxylase LpxO [Duganella alba]MRX20181.1 lipid A hydroxylase LpxO [Duganella alba]